MEAVSTQAPRVPPARLLRLAEIVGQREVTEEEAARNRQAAAQHAPELKRLEELKERDPERFDQDAVLLRRLRDLRNLSARPRRARQATPGLIPVSESSWWAGIKIGRYPTPVKLGPGTTAWRSEEIETLLRVGSQAAA